MPHINKLTNVLFVSTKITTHYHYLRPELNYKVLFFSLMLI